MFLLILRNVLYGLLNPGTLGFPNRMLWYTRSELRVCTVHQ